MTLIRDDLTNVEAPIAVGARYEGLCFAGPTQAFDRLLDNWLTRAVDLGIIGSGLGQLFPINLQRMQKDGMVKVGYLLLAGMGEPGRFAADDLSFMISNVTVAVMAMGHDQFATTLFGTRRNELPVEEAVRGFVNGIVDGYEHFRAIANAAHRELRHAAMSPLSVLLVETDKRRLVQIKKALETLPTQSPVRGLQLKVLLGRDTDGDFDSGDDDSESEASTAFLRVVRKTEAAAPNGPSETELLEFSALSDTSAVSVRVQEINSYLLRNLQDRIINSRLAKTRERYGRFFADLVIPDDFRRLTDGAANLTLEVDETTAAYPWELIAEKRELRTTTCDGETDSKTSFLGATARVSRQFRSLLSPPPSSPPPLNTKLRVLVVADPAPDEFSLPWAREEGFSVIEVLRQARRAWEKQYDIKVTVRIGSSPSQDLEPKLAVLRAQSDLIESAEACDPIDIATLIVDEQYDIIHYAGHGFVDQKAGRAGWILAKHYSLSAQELFRIRQVPRLVFANACFSSTAGEIETSPDHVEQRKRLVGIARALFARGIPNFIGTGWQVNDECARECARWFYAKVLGLSRPDSDGELITTSEPATISAALRDARDFVFRKRPEVQTS